MQDLTEKTKMYILFLEEIQRLGFEIVETLHFESEISHLHIFIKHQNGFAVKVRGAVQLHLYRIELFFIIEGGQIFKWLTVPKNLPFKHRDNVAEVENLRDCLDILAQISEGYFSRKGTLDVIFADPALGSRAKV